MDDYYFFVASSITTIKNVLLFLYNKINNKIQKKIKNKKFELLCLMATLGATVLVHILENSETIVYLEIVDLDFLNY